LDLSPINYTWKPMSDNKARLEGTLEGRVQGVGFRFFTRQTAERLGVNGWVRNEPDGSVTVVAEGDRDQLEKLADAIRKGPPPALVETADISWEEPDHGFSGFVVRR
jgi:acylphosphatase